MPRLYRPEDYDYAYYAHSCGPIPYGRSAPWIAFFDRIAVTLIRLFQPQSVFDVGCAMGLLVEGLRDRGVAAWGCDLSPYAIAQVRPDLQAFCRCQSASEPWDRSYDLVTCIEVLEHVTPDMAAAILTQMAQHTRRVVFSSTPDDLTEESHVNVHPDAYWVDAFDRVGFQPDPTADVAVITPWARVFHRLAP